MPGSPSTYGSAKSFVTITSYGGETPDCPTAESTAARRNSRRPWAITTALTFIPRFLRLRRWYSPGSLFMLPPEARRAMRAPVSRSDWDDHPR